MNYCDELDPVINIVKAVLALIRFGVPILLIVMGTIDLAKAVISSKEDEMKKAQGTLIKRIIYAVAVFLVFTIVSVVMTMVANAGTGDDDVDDWRTCWSK